MVSIDWFLIGMLFISTVGVLITALEFVSKDKKKEKQIIEGNIIKSR